jgi:hypothetical protein
MSLYKLTYPFESSGGNIEYQTTQQIQKEADEGNIDITLVTTGISIKEDVIEGIAIVEASDDRVSESQFQSASDIHRVAAGDTPESTKVDHSEGDPAAEPEPAEDIQRFEESNDLTDLLASVNESPGRGFLLDSDLTRCHPYERDVWLVALRGTEIDAETELTKADVVEFYRDNRDRLEDDPTLKIGGFHRPTASTIQLTLAALLPNQQDAKELAERTDSFGPVNFYRFELAKASLAVGESTHGPGQVNAVFRNGCGDTICSRELAYRSWHDGLDVNYHPLGVTVEGDLYRPVCRDGVDSDRTDVGDPIRVETYRGSESKPWQFGVTRHDEQLLITQARGPPEKFDPVLKRFPIETKSVGVEPLVFSHTASRRIWSEDPLNSDVQSHRSEALQTQFLYADDEGWHLIQPTALGEPTEQEDSSFEPTQLDGISVRSSLLRAAADGEVKATVEHEYRITGDALDSCDRLYALSYHEANEESIDRLQWEIADAVAYELVQDRGA